MPPLAARFGVIPNLHLRIAAQINATVGLRDRLIFEHEFEVAVVFVGGGVRPMPVIVKCAVLYAPLLQELSLLLRKRLRAIFGFGSFVRVIAMPTI